MQDRIPQIAETACANTPVGSNTVSRAKQPAAVVLAALRTHTKLTFAKAALRACSFTWAAGEQSKDIERAFVTEVLQELADLGVATVEIDGTWIFTPTPTAAIPSPEGVEYPNITSIEYAIKRTTRP